MSARTCPRHGSPLIGGPVLYECTTDEGHVVYAADIDREYHPQAVAS